MHFDGTIILLYFIEMPPRTVSRLKNKIIVNCSTCVRKHSLLIGKDNTRESYLGFSLAMTHVAKPYSRYGSPGGEAGYIYGCRALAGVLGTHTPLREILNTPLPW